MLRVFALILLVSCSSFDSQRARSGYESFVWSELRERSVVSEGRNLVNVRWFVLGDEYFTKRADVLGYDDALTKSFKVDGKHYLLVALQMKPSALFTKSDFKVFWNGQEIPAYSEIASVIDLRSLYPFAYPFHRVFLYEIAPSDAGKLSVWTPWGKLEDEVRQ